MRTIAAFATCALACAGAGTGPAHAAPAASGAPPAPWTPAAKRADAVRVLVITGGHDHDPDFYAAFDHEAIAAKVDPHPNGLERDVRRRADVVVLYDTVPQVAASRKKTLQEFVESGGGVVVLHHGIVSAADWPWWYEDVVGGRWLFQPTDGRAATTYKHGQEIAVRPVKDHPITRGLRPFRIIDETYKGLWISPRVEVLLETDHPESDRPLAWIGPYPKARVVYVQLGHDRSANLNPTWQRIVRNAILWTAGKLR